MSKCETCARKQYGYLCDGCIHDPDNKDLYEPMTNADRIRAMSDEELSEFLIDLADDGNLRIRDWLQRPSGEEDKHEP